MFINRLTIVTAACGAISQGRQRSDLEVQRVNSLLRSSMWETSDLAECASTAGICCLVLAPCYSTAHSVWRQARSQAGDLICRSAAEHTPCSSIAAEQPTAQQ